MVNWIWNSKSCAFVSAFRKGEEKSQIHSFKQYCLIVQKKLNYVQAIARNHFGIQFHANCFNIKNRIASHSCFCFIVVSAVVVVAVHVALTNQQQQPFGSLSSE